MSKSTIKELLQSLIAEAFEVNTDTENQQDNQSSIPTNIDTSKEEAQISPEFLNTDERQLFPFAAKYSMLKISPNEFIMDMLHLYSKLSKNGMSPEEISKILMPENQSAAKDFYTFLSKIHEYIISRGGEDVVGYQIPEEVKKYGEEAAKRYLTHNSSDAKAMISYEFSKKRLTPRGFWQLQFMARVLAGKPFLPEEEVLFIRNRSSQILDIAYDVLRNFYKHAFVGMAVQLAGRFHKQKELTQRDVRLQTDIEVSVDHFITGIATGKYDVSRNNVGAWAFTVMKNKLIDFIKELTSVSYRTGIDTKSGFSTHDAFVQNGLTTWFSFLDPKKADIPTEDLSEPVQKVKLNTGEIAFKYHFASPEVAHVYLEAAEDGELNNIFKHLTKSGERKLMNIGAKLHTRKDANFNPETQAEPVIPGEQDKIEKGLNVLEYNLYVQLFDFAFKRTASFDTAFGEKSVFNVDSIMDAPKSQARTFKADIGKAIFTFLGYFDYTHVWSRKASGKFNAEQFNQITSNPDNIEAAKANFKTTNEAMYFAILGFQKGLDWTKLNNVSIGKRNDSGELTGIVDPNYVDENGDVYEELLPLTKTVISRSRKGVISREIESEINADREIAGKPKFNPGQLQAISSAAKQMEDLIKTEPKLADLIKRILKAKQQKNQTLNEMEDLSKLRALIKSILEETLLKENWGDEDSYEMNTDNIFGDDDEQDIEDHEDDLEDLAPQKPAMQPTGVNAAAEQLLKNDNIEFIAHSISSADYKLISAIADEFNKLKKTNLKKHTAIADALVSMYQAGNKTRQIQNFFAIYYLESGKKFDNSNIRVLLKSFPGVATEDIEDALTDSFMKLLSMYKAQGNSFDGFVHRVASNVLKKDLTTADHRTVSLDAPMSDKGSKTRGDMMGAEDGDMTGDSTADATDSFGSSEDDEADESPEEKQNRLDKALQGTKEDIVAFKEALKREAANFPKWKRYLRAFENIWQKGNSWKQELGNTANWGPEIYDVLGTGKKLLIDLFIEPALVSMAPVQEVKVTKQRVSDVWSAFDVSKSGVIHGIKDPQKFIEIRTKIATLQNPGLDKIMNFIAGEEGSHFNILELGDPKKATIIIDQLKAPIIHQLRELGKKTNISIKAPVSAVRKLKRNVNKGHFTQDNLDQVTNIDEDTAEEGIPISFTEEMLSSEDMDSFVATFNQIRAAASPLSETYLRMQKLLNGNKLAK